MTEEQRWQLLFDKLDRMTRLLERLLINTPPPPGPSTTTGMTTGTHVPGGG